MLLTWLRWEEARVRAHHVAGPRRDHVLESIGLGVNVRYELLPVFSPNDGRVINQSPLANLEVDLGTTVTIVVGQAEDPEGVDAEDPSG